MDFCYRDHLSHSDCSSQGLFQHACCTRTHFFWSFVALYLLFFMVVLIVFHLSLFEMMMFFCQFVLFFFIYYILQLFISIFYSGCNRARRPDRCHVDLIATATSKKHRPQLFRGWNQGCVSLCLYGFSFSLPHPLYVYGLSVAHASL